MKKRAALGIGILSMLLLVTAAYNPASATTYAVGVKVGDTADYTVSFSFNANISKMHVFVYGVVGTVVTLNSTYTLKNGTALEPEQVDGDIAISGDLFLWLVAKNLTTNDPLYSGSSYNISNTETMTVGGNSRTVIHFNITAPGIIGNIWWDQQTGILVKSNIGIIFLGWWNTSLTATSLWSAGLFGLSWTTLAIIGVGAVILIAVIAVVLRRRH